MGNSNGIGIEICIYMKEGSNRTSSNSSMLITP